jgi:SnoaL-like polyketide cyclase
VGSSRAVSAVRSAVMRLNDDDIDGYLDSFEPTCRRWISGFAQPLTLTEVGDGLRQLHAAFEGLHLVEDVLFGDERFACARWRMRGLHVRDYVGVPPTGRSIDIETCEVYELGDALVATSWVYGDLLAQLVAQLTGPPIDADGRAGT